jgi:uncharacterized membrane protein YhaH (DUF805 family)
MPYLVVGHVEKNTGYFHLFSLMIMILLANAEEFFFKTSMLISIYFIAIFIPYFSVGVRRMHDTGRSGWYLLIPIYGFILTITEGVNGENEYGADPKRESEISQSADTAPLA